VGLRYELFEEPAGKLLYTTSLTHTVPEPLDISPRSLVSYLNEPQLAGDWTLGVSEGSLEGLTLVLTVSPKAGGLVAVTETVTPKALSGSFSLGVGKLPVGAYEVEAALKQGEKVLATGKFSFDRVMGPFGAQQKGE